MKQIKNNIINEVLDDIDMYENTTIDTRSNKRINIDSTKQQHRLENKFKHMLQLDGMK